VPTLKSILKAPCGSAGFRKGVFRLRKRALTILMYHGIAPQPPAVPDWCQVPVQEFAAQMAYVSSAYNVLPLRDIVDRLEHRAALPDHAAAVTFDDAFQSFEATALPVLERHGLPATVFVVTSLADSGEPPWPERLYHAIVHTGETSLSLDGRTWDLSTNEARGVAYPEIVAALRGMEAEKKTAVLATLVSGLGVDRDRSGGAPAGATMRWEDIERLAGKEAIHFGAHTHTHEDLPVCSPERQRVEIETSRERLREHVGYADLFAYPNGEYTAFTKSLVREAGFRAAVTTKHALNGRGADLYELSRVGIGPGLSPDQFEGKVLGY